jgi:endoglycosylceramidase
LLFKDDADKYFQSWSYWQFKSFNDITTQATGSSESLYNDDGTLQLQKVKALSRTYAYAIAGDPMNMQFDPSSAYFVLTYKTNNRAKGPTEIYLNQEFWYPDGFQVSIVPPQAASWTQSEYNRIRVIRAPNIPSGQQITVIVKPNQKK